MRRAVSAVNAQATIPIRNIYYLLCYAWRRLEERDLLAVDVDDVTELVDLLARVLLGGVRHLRRRGLDRGYHTHEEETATIRGRIDLSRTLERGLLSRGRVWCRYNELTHDVLHNRLLRSTLELLAADPALDRDLAADLTQARRWFGNVTSIALTPSAFRMVQLYRNNAVYALLLDVCRLVMERMLASEQRGPSLFRDFLRDDRAMRRLFEDFVRNFYSYELPDCRVSAKQFGWDHVAADAESAAVLPGLRTDVTIEGPAGVVIVDTKYTPHALAEGQYGGQRLRTEHLYQIYAYMRNAEALGGNWSCSAGVLLYPSVGETFRYEYELGAHRLLVCSVNLGANWRDIRAELLDVVRCACTLTPLVAS